jgi:hypothetical protein
MTETKTIVTTEEVEMVECSSCEQTIPEKEAHYFAIRNSKSKHNSSGQTNGWACGHCVDHPINLPVIYQTLGENTGWVELTTAFFLIVLSITMIVQIPSMI